MNEQLLLRKYIDDEAIRALAGAIHDVWEDFQKEEFVEACIRSLDNAETSKGTQSISEQLLSFLPPSIPQALKILTDCLPEPTQVVEAIPTTPWIWPIADFIREYSDEFWEETMSAIHKLCQCGKAEYAIRPILKLFPQKTVQRLVEWCADPSEKVRLFCCEACRIRIPWASRTELPRHLVISILNSLKYDASPLVQDAVADHLADLGKMDEEWLLQNMWDWSQTGNKNSAMIAHKTVRSLAREGNERALKIMGLKPLDLERASFFVTPQQVAFGEEVTATLEITGDLENQKRMLINWIVYFAREGRTPYRKVYEGTEVELEEDANAYVCERTFRLSPYTTRKLCPGVHRIEVQINGQVIAGLDFKLVERHLDDNGDGQ